MLRHEGLRHTHRFQDLPYIHPVFDEYHSDMRQVVVKFGKGPESYRLLPRHQSTCLGTFWNPGVGAKTSSAVG